MASEEKVATPKEDAVSQIGDMLRGVQHFLKKKTQGTSDEQLSASQHEVGFSQRNRSHTTFKVAYASTKVEALKVIFKHEVGFGFRLQGVDRAYDHSGFRTIFHPRKLGPFRKNFSGGLFSSIVLMSNSKFSNTDIPRYSINKVLIASD